MADHWILIVVAAFVASILAAVAGTGGGIILLPVLVSVFGVRDAVPMYAVVQVVGNLTRVILNRSTIDYQVVRWFVIGAVPFAIAGAWLFSRLPDTGLLKFLGAFLLLSTVARWLSKPLKSRFDVRWFAPVGGAFAVISAIAGSAGPFLAPFYLAYGLTKGAFIGTEALGTAFMHVAKLGSYQSSGAINASIWASGLLLSPVMLVGTFVGKQVMDGLSIHTFTRIIDAIIVGFGVWFLLK